jgi:hypothetical protein
MAARHRFGTNIRNSIDAENFRKAARSVGADLRYWVAQGTVAKVDTETGEFDPTDPTAIWNASDGIDVDVKLEPLEIPVTCRYAGIQAGEVTIFSPIRPGDIVKVEFPDGDLTGGIISAIMQSRSNRQPTENGVPIFGNDRLLIHAKTVPIDIRLAGAAGATPIQVLLEQNGTVTVTADKIKLGGANAAEQYVEGTSYRSAEDTMLDALKTGLSAAAAAAVGPLAPLAPGLTAAATAVTVFQTAAAAANGYLSKVVDGK